MKSKFLINRENNFLKICSNFKHEKISNLIVAHKIKKSLFSELTKNVKKYLRKNKKYNFLNRTPNGKLLPKKENQIEFNNVVKSYRNLIMSLGFSKNINKWVIPSIRYKESKMNPKNLNRSSNSELIHSDVWAGWDSNSILVQIPIIGDTKNNRIKYFDIPENANKKWITKKSFSTAQKEYASKCKPLLHHYKKGYIYVSDIIVTHKTERLKNSKPRVSIDIPILLGKKKINNKFGTTDLISTHKMKFLGEKYFLECILKMGEIDGISEKKIPSSCVFKKIKKNI